MGESQTVGESNPNYRPVDKESAKALKAKHSSLKDKVLRMLRIGGVAVGVGAGTIGVGIGATSVVDHENPIDVTKNLVSNSQDVGGALKQKVGFSSDSPTTASSTSPDRPTTTVTK